MKNLSKQITFNITVKYANDKNANPKIVIVHNVCGVDTIQILKKVPKVMNYLRINYIHISIHNQKEEEWVLKVIGFFTNLYPEQMPIEYSTNIISEMIKNP
jgi:hypothetical protein